MKRNEEYTVGEKIFFFSHVNPFGIGELVQKHPTGKYLSDDEGKRRYASEWSVRKYGTQRVRNFFIYGEDGFEKGDF